MLLSSVSSISHTIFPHLLYIEVALFSGHTITHTVLLIGLCICSHNDFIDAYILYYEFFVIALYWQDCLQGSPYHHKPFE